MSIEAQLQFIQEIDKLKSIERQTLNYYGGRRENSAEHSWHLAMAVLIFQNQAEHKNLDIFKALKMALLHDIVEIDAGDVVIYGDQSQKAEKEAVAAQRLFGLLPADQAQELSEIWEEFEKRESPEARYVASLDRFLPLMSNYLSGGYSWKNHQVTYEQVIEKNQGTMPKSVPTLWKTALRMLDEAVSKGFLKKRNL